MCSIITRIYEGGLISFASTSIENERENIF